MKSAAHCSCVLNAGPPTAIQLVWAHIRTTAVNITSLILPAEIDFLRQAALTRFLCFDCGLFTHNHFQLVFHAARNFTRSWRGAAWTYLSHHFLPFDFFFFAVLAAALNAFADGAPLDPGLRIFSLLPALIRARFA